MACFPMTIVPNCAMTVRVPLRVFVGVLAAIFTFPVGGVCEGIAFQNGRECWICSPEGAVIERVAIPEEMAFHGAASGQLFFVRFLRPGILRGLSWTPVNPSPTGSRTFADLPVAANSRRSDEVLREIGMHRVSFSPDTLFVALVIYRFDHSTNSLSDEVYRYALGTASLTQLTSNGLLNYCPTVSPDGKWIAFYSLPHESDPEKTVGWPWSKTGLLKGYALEVVSAAGGTTRQAAPHGYFKYGPGGIAWSPDSAVLYFEHGDSSEGKHPLLYSVGLNEGKLRKISGTYQCAQDPAASREGRFVACRLANHLEGTERLSGGIGIIDTATGQSRILTDDLGWGPKWSPSGKYILYSALDPTAKTGQERLYVIKPDGTGKTDLTPPGRRGSLTAREAFWLN